MIRLRRPSGAWVTSLAIHLLVAAVFIQAILARHPFFMSFGRPAPEAVVEHIGFLSLPQPKTPGAATAGRNGGDGVAKRPSSVPMPTAPTSVPTTITPAPKGPPVATSEPSSGPLIGGGGQLRGIQPRYEDPRLWAAPGRIASAPKTATERLDSVIVGDIGAYNDSVRVANAGKRAPGDWTFEKNGQKYGIDSKYIRLGPVSIPTAVLAMLPINLTGNPTTYERNRTLNSRHDEIFEQAQRGMNNADFDKAVKSIRERKERERREAEAEKKKAADQAAPPSQP
ncbi:MAG: hypothetical protein M3R65_03560 [Gemmatimonadota bacterium]|nr:hypothetical protein [Gemmatimonadota bacterium]